jgi:hypothetical protein
MAVLALLISAEVDGLKISEIHSSFLESSGSSGSFMPRAAAESSMQAAENTTGFDIPQALVVDPDSEGSTKDYAEQNNVRSSRKARLMRMQSSEMDRRKSKDEPKKGGSGGCVCSSKGRPGESVSSCGGGCSCVCTSRDDPYKPTQDDLRDYAYEGEGSTPGSLSSCCSGEKTQI